MMGSGARTCGWGERVGGWGRRVGEMEGRDGGGEKGGHECVLCTLSTDDTGPWVEEIRRRMRRRRRRPRSRGAGGWTGGTGRGGEVNWGVNE